MGALATTLAVLASACGDATSPAADAPEVPTGRVVLYTSMPEAIVGRLEGVFEGAFPDIEGNMWIAPGSAEAGGIDLEVVRGRTGDLEARFADELAAGAVGADVIWLAEPSSYEGYKAGGVLAPYTPPEEAPIRADLIDPDGFFVAGRIINMVVAWNTDLRPGGLDDWPQLLAGGAAVFPSPESGAARAAVKALMTTYGDDVFVGFVAGGGRSVPSNGAARDGLTDGTYEMAAVLDYMIRLAKDRGEPVDLAYPASGTVIIPSPLAITADAANPEAAEVFLDFVLSRQGQQIIVEIGSFYPVRNDVTAPRGAPPLADITSLPVDWAELSAERDDIAELWADLYGD